MQTYKSFSFLLLFFVLTLVAKATSPPKLTTASIPNWIRETKKLPIAPNLEDISDGYYFQEIEYQVDLATQTRFYRTVKVLTENAGTQNAGQVQISFEPTYQTLVLHELYVIRDGNQLNRLQLNKFQILAFETELSRSIYNGTYTAYLALEDLRKDDKIVLSYSLKGFNPVFGGKFFDSYTLQSFEPIGLIHVNYIVPKGRAIQFKPFSGTPSPVQTNQGGATSYVWERAGTEKVEYETHVPYWHSTVQRIECSEFANWADVADWAAEVNPIPSLPNENNVSKYADELWIKAKGDSLEYVRQIADFVQNDIRYMGVEVGEYSHRANSPEKVLVQRYGDCKDKSVLMATMLKRKGIKSTLVLVNSYEEYKLQEYLPSPGAFNHMVVHFTVDGRGQFIDPTMTDQGGPFRDRYFPFYGKVLLVEPKAKLHDTDKHISGSTRVEERFHLQKNGSATLDVLTIYKGSDADQIRGYFKQTAKNQTEKSYLEYYQTIYKDASKRAPLSYEDDVESNIFQIRESYSIENLVVLDPASNRMTISAYASNLSSSVPKVTAKRSSPIALQYPLSMEHIVYIINPEGVTVPTTRESTNTSRGDYYFGKNIISQGDTLKITFALGTHDTYVKESESHHYISDFSDSNSLFSCAVYVDSDGFITGSNSQGQIHWWSVFGFVTLLLILTVFTWRYYHHQQASSLIVMYEEPDYDTVGGWLIFLAIALFISPLRIFFSVMVPGYFSQQLWQTLDYNLGVPPTLYATFLITEFIANTVLIFMAAYCFYLLIKRRDIFPQTLFATIVFQLLVVVFSSVMYLTIHRETVENSGVISEIFRAVAFATIWGLYLFKSTRVKGTFVVKSTKFEI